jgi:hypothetical protein
MVNHIYHITGKFFWEVLPFPGAYRGDPHCDPIDRRIEAASDDDAVAKIKAEYAAKAPFVSGWWWDGPEITDEGDVPDDIRMRRAGMPDLFSCVESD